jgi:proline iminopeptidase
MRRLLSIVAIIAGLGALLYSGRFGSTPPFRDSGGKVIAGSVADVQRVRLGGVEQSIVIRGRDAGAPILIWLHGGPGTDETGMWRRYNAVLEDHFVVVYWAQRGAGKSYHSDIPPGSMTLAQFVADLDELVTLLQGRFHQRKVALVGHSWGTNIGVVYARAYPDKVSALVSVGQIANSVEGERRSYAFTLAEAKRRNDTTAIAELTALGPPPYPIDAIMQQRGWLEKFGGGSFHIPTSLPKLLWQSFQAHEVTWLDGIGFARGAPFSLAALAPQVAKFDWMHTATHFAVPVFIVAGRFDHNTDAALAHDYFDAIVAPSKQFKWFEQSAHSPMFEEPAAFNAFMIDTVLPVVTASRAAPLAVDSGARRG